MDPLTIEELDSYLKANFCYIYGDEFEKMKRNDGKAKNRCCFNGKYQGVIYTDCNLKFVIPWQLILSNNRSIYDFHQIKFLA